MDGTGCDLVEICQPMFGQGAPPQVRAQAALHNGVLLQSSMGGHQQEFLQLFLKNHCPLLNKTAETGRIVSVKIESPANHMTEEARWAIA